MNVPKPLRVVLLGKAGNGKSSLANTIFGNPVFKVSNFDSSFCVSESQTRQVNGRSLTLIDTPGLLAPDHSEEDMKREILRCITECSPGPHAVLIVLKVEKFTEHEQAVISQICQHFSEEVLTHAVVVFTHGDQLPEGMTIQEYVSQSEGLSDLVQKCGGRCHVFDNRYWKNAEQDDYRSNKFQVTQLLNNIDDILKLNNGGHYTNSILQEVEEEIQIEADRIRKSSSKMSKEDILKQAKINTFKKLLEGGKKAWRWDILGFGVLAGLAVIAAAWLIQRYLQGEAEIPLPEMKEPEEALVESVVSAGQQLAETVASIQPEESVLESAVTTGQQLAETIVSKHPEEALVESVVSAGQQLADTVPQKSAGPDYIWERRELAGMARSRRDEQQFSSPLTAAFHTL
ncbi:GTPase IMAP family member 7-like [Oryzias melastigma]|uniref:GTPase IMAP family member 7-like n=1 Tax=Oryzias melastigma TaxID=30732 RepID=UPI00168D6C01|nr:GTPase IMAP family member 7-like [Oryzias melastigma]